MPNKAKERSGKGGGQALLDQVQQLDSSTAVSLWECPQSQKQNGDISHKHKGRAGIEINFFTSSQPGRLMVKSTGT